MKNALKVFKRDMKSIIKNPVALLIIVGVCVLPSLYAWVNIKASWDPYENTGDISVAIVNNDKGTTFADKDLNIGDDVVEELKSNDVIGWRFVNSEDANMGVVDGTYYAMIEIPEDFSEKLTSLTTDKPEKPKVIYKVDTKMNPVATKISDAAQSTLINEVTSNFISTVNKEVFSVVNEAGNKAEENRTQIISLKNAIISVNKNMDVVTGLLEGLDSNAKNLGQFLTEVRGTLPTITDGISNIQQSTINSKDLKEVTQKNLNNSIDNLKISLSESQASINRLNDLAQNLSHDNNKSGKVSQINKDINSVNNAIAGNVKYLNEINNVQPNKAISDSIVALTSVQNSVGQAKDTATSMQNEVSSSGEVSDNTVQVFVNSIKNINAHLIEAVNQFDSGARPALNTITQSLINTTDDATKLLETSKGLFTQIDNLLKSGTEGSELAATVSTKLKEDLLSFKSIIKQLSSKLEKVGDDDIQKIINILQSNPEVMGDFIAEPFNLEEKPVFHIPNYGSAMTPIYSVLALWVGATILVSLLKTHPGDFEGSENITIKEKHFGKLLTFIFLAFIQGVVVTVGNKVLLDVYVVNFPLMVAFGVVTAVAFTTIVFTLVGVFGNIGKDIAIIFMIIQLAGCGGTYPIQVDPKFFRVLQPFFPFTYGVGGFREAIAGPLKSSVLVDFAMLFLYIIIFLIIGAIFKEKLHDKVQNFEANFKNSRVGE